MNKEILQMQLHSQIDEMSNIEGIDLSGNLLYTAKVLVESAFKESEDNYDEVFDMLYPIVNVVSNYLEKSPSLASDQRKNTMLETLRKQVVFSEEELSDKQRKIDDIKATLVDLQKKQEELQHQYDEMTESEESLVEICDRLQNEIDAYPDDMIQSLTEKKKEKEKKLAAINEKNSELSELEEDIRVLDQRLSSFPEELRAFAECRARIEQQLLILNDPENQFDERELRSLEQEVEEKNKQLNEFRRRRDELETLLTNLDLSYEDEIEEFNVRTRETVTEALDFMHDTVSERVTYLAELKEKADEISRMTEECRGIHVKYSGWLAADRTAGDALATLSESQDNETYIRHSYLRSLQKSLGQSLKAAEQKLDEIADNLREADKLISKGMTAAGEGEKRMDQAAKQL